MIFEHFTFVLERLFDFVTNQIQQLNVDEVEEIRNLQFEVEIAQNLLKNVDEVQRQADLKPELKTRVQQVMAILGEIEDFIDSQTWNTGTLGALKRKRSGVEAKELEKRLSDLVQCLKGYDLKGDDVIPRRQRLPTQPDNFREEFIVGLREDVEAYVAKLVPPEGANHGSSTDLAIFGMGGSGKTTAARLVYNHREITEHFSWTSLQLGANTAHHRWLTCFFSSRVLVFVMKWTSLQLGANTINQWLTSISESNFKK